MALPPRFMPNNPFMIDYISQHPDSMLSRIYTRHWGQPLNPQLMMGGNNARPTPVSQPVQTPPGPVVDPTRPQPGAYVNDGSFGAHNSFAYPTQGKGIVSFKAGGMMTPQGTVQRPPMPTTPAYSTSPRDRNAVQSNYGIPAFAGGGMMTATGQRVAPPGPIVDPVRPWMNNQPTRLLSTFARDRNAVQSNYGVPSFAGGGMMTEQGTAMPPNLGQGPALGAAAPPQMNGQQLQQEAQNFVRSNPQEAEKIKTVMLQAMQSGELTYDELNLAVQLAKTALANPSSYPQVRQFAIQNGLATDQDLPAEYDQGMLFILLVIGQSLQGAGGANPQASGNAMMGQAPAPTQQGGVPSYKQGGLIPNYESGGMTHSGNSEKGDKGKLSLLHKNEYVATAKSVLYHGKKTYDKLEQQAHEAEYGKQE